MADPIALTPNERPSWHDNRSDMFDPRAARFAKKLDLHDGRILAGWNTLYGVDVADQIRRGGIKYIKSPDIPIINQVEWTHNSILERTGRPSAYDTDGNSAPYGAVHFTQPEMASLANGTAMAGLVADEIAEPTKWSVAHDSPQRQWYLQALKDKYDAYNASPQGQANPIPYQNIGGYGTFAIFAPRRWTYAFSTGAISPLDPRFTKGFESQAEARKFSQVYFNGDYQKGVGANIKNYADWDTYAPVFYLMAYCAELLHYGMTGEMGGMGDTGGRPLLYVDWSNKEGLGYDFGAGVWSRPHEGGIVKNLDYSHEKIDFEHQLGCQYMIGMLRLKGVISFEVPNTWGTNPGIISNKQSWTGSGTAPQQVAANTFTSAYPEEPYMGHDCRAICGELYEKTLATAGEPWVDVEYRFLGTENWFTPANNRTESLSKAAGFQGPFGEGANDRQGRPDIVGRRKNSNYDIAEFDASKHKWKKEQIVVRIPGTQTERLLTSKGNTLRTYSGTI